MKIEIHVDPSKRREDGLAAISIRVPALKLDYDLDLPFKRLYERCSVPDPLVLDFLITASLCYVIDKVVPRSSAVDNWTRELEVEFPVSTPDAWASISGDLETTLGFLTGDLWQVSFHKSETGFFWLPRRRGRVRRMPLVPRMGPASSVCLFSGGLDSVTGAIDLLAGDNEQKVLLVGHYDAAGPHSQQESLFAEIRQRYPQRADLVQVRVSHRPDAALESTLRSRSLVFMALGIYAARASGPDVTLYAPENGLIAINIPLTPSRAGSCSTRTMHPFFLDKLRSVLRGMGFGNRIINPFELKTKGECIVECLNQPLLKTVVDSSVSCSHGTRRQNWVRKGANNCGYCVPCVFRRAALHRADLDEGHKYGIDVCAGELRVDDEGESGDDLRAVLDFLRNQKTTHEISREIRAIAPIKNLTEYTATVERGFDEIRSLIRDKARGSIRREVGY
jgi:7-cyano-7-deazaguanine synthase in queuosine biosynthesis